MVVNPGSLALLIPIVAILAGASVKVARLYSEGRNRPGARDEEARLQALEEEVAALRHELTEAQERLDFTERMMTQSQQSNRLPPPS